MERLRAMLRGMWREQLLGANDVLAEACNNSGIQASEQAKGLSFTNTPAQKHVPMTGL